MRYLSIGLTLLLSLSFAQGALIEDNFDRADGYTLGTASDGTNVWERYGYVNALESNTMRIGRTVSPSNATGYARIGDLAAQPNMNIVFDLEVNSSPLEDGGWFKISPGTSSTSWNAAGWMFAVYDNAVRLSFYDGGETKLTDSVFPLDQWYEVTIQVTGADSTLTVNGVTYQTPTGQSLDRDGGKLLIYGQCPTGHLIYANMDNLSVTVPEPTTMGLLASGSGLVLLRRKR